MNVELERLFGEAEQYGNQLIRQISEDQEYASACFRGEVLSAYRNAGESAKQKTQEIIEKLQSLRAMQP